MEGTWNKSESCNRPLSDGTSLALSPDAENARNLAAQNVTPSDSGTRWKLDRKETNKILLESHAVVRYKFSLNEYTRTLGFL